MTYVSLKDLYYKDESKWRQEYLERFTSKVATVLNFQIGEEGYPQQYSSFFVNVPEILNLVEAIDAQVLQLLRLQRNISLDLLAGFRFRLLSDEILATNEIEGIHSSRQEFEVAWNWKKDKFPEHLKLGKMVQKYRILSEGEQMPFFGCEDIRQLYDDFVAEEVSAEDSKDAPDGVLFRKGPVDISNRTGKVLHKGSMPEERICSDLEYALKVLYDEEQPFLIRLALFHYLFANIHPFYNGNGRMDRLITSYFLGRRYDPLMGIRISVVIARDKKKYYELFRTVENDKNRGDLTPFVIGFLEIILDTVQDVRMELVTLIRKVEKAWEDIIQLTSCKEHSTLAAFYQQLLYGTLVTCAGVRVQQLAQSMQLSDRTIRSLLAKVDSSWLQVEEQGREYVYRLNLRMLPSFQKDVALEYIVLAHRGQCVFDYSSHNGILRIQYGVGYFDTQWAKCGLGIIYAVAECAGIAGIAVIKRLSNIENSIDIEGLNFSCDKQQVMPGDGVVWKDHQGRMLLTIVQGINNNFYGDAQDALVMSFKLM